MNDRETQMLLSMQISFQFRRNKQMPTAPTWPPTISEKVALADGRTSITMSYVKTGCRKASTSGATD